MYHREKTYLCNSFIHKKIILKRFIPIFLLLVAVQGFCQEPVKVNVTKPGTLSTLLTEAQKDTCQYLVISGKLNSADIKVLRRMAGADGHGKLQYLDLRDVKIVSSEEPYLTIQNAEETIVPWVSAERGSRWLSYSEFDPIVVLRKACYVLLRNDKKLDAETTAMNVSQWKKVKLQTTDAKGHRVEKSKDGHYNYIAMTHKKMVCVDMFYLCPNLRLVILPIKGSLNEEVAIADDPIRYTEATKVLSFK